MNSDFEDYYAKVWGARWPSLRAALLQDKTYTTIYPQNDVGNKPYYLDVASQRIADYLKVSSCDRVLDMCAAPGGKAMVLLNAMNGQGFFWGNDKERFARLQRVLSSYPQDNKKLTAMDARTMGIKIKDKFSKILLDAPCSSEWHWLQDPSLMQCWRLSRPKRLMIDQYALLASAVMLLDVRGSILYVTCAINPYENQAVIAKAMKRLGSQIRVDDFVPDFAEDAGLGFYCLPDVGNNGPLYGCLLHKI